MLWALCCRSESFLTEEISSAHIYWYLWRLPRWVFFFSFPVWMKHEITLSLPVFVTRSLNLSPVEHVQGGKKEEAVCLLRFRFQAACFEPDFSLPSKAPVKRPWSVSFSVNIPPPQTTCLFLYTVFLLSPRGSAEVVRSMQQWGNQKTDRTSRLKRERCLTRHVHPALCLGPSVSNCMFKKIINNNSNNKLLSHLINRIQREKFGWFWRRLDYRRPTTFWSLKS